MSANEEALRAALAELQAAVTERGGDGPALSILSGRSDDPFGSRRTFYRIDGILPEQGWVRAGALIDRINFAVSVLRLLD